MVGEIVALICLALIFTCLKDKLGNNKESYLLSLCSRSWFERLWTVQELLLSRNSRVICGYESISWASFAFEAEKFLTNSYLNEETIPVRCRGFFIRLHYWQYIQQGNQKSNDADAPELRSAYVLASCASSQKCSDRKDKIFALYTILHELGFRIPDPDYNKSVAEIYAETILLYITQFGSLNILESLGSAFRSDRDPLLPTWVPSFNHTWTTNDDDDSGSLSLQGNRVDTTLLLQRSPGLLPLRGKKLTTINACNTGDNLSTRTFLAISFEGDIPSIILWAKCLRQWCLFASSHQVASNMVEGAVTKSLSSLLTRRGASNSLAESGSCLPHFKTMLHLLEQSKTVDLPQGIPEVWMEQIEDPKDPDSKFICLAAFEADPNSRDWIMNTMHAILDHRLFITSSNHMGIGPYFLQEQDVVVQFAGARIHMIVRPNNGKYDLIGPAYIPGMALETDWKQDNISQLDVFTLQ